MVFCALTDAYAKILPLARKRGMLDDPWVWFQGELSMANAESEGLLQIDVDQNGPLRNMEKIHAEWSTYFGDSHKDITDWVHTPVCGHEQDKVNCGFLQICIQGLFTQDMQNVDNTPYLDANYIILNST